MMASSRQDRRWLKKCIAGDKRAIDPLAYQIAGLGKYNLVSINYRFANDESAPWPQIIYDVNAAIRWIKLNSNKLGIDPDKLILAGESAEVPGQPLPQGRTDALLREPLGRYGCVLRAELVRWCRAVPRCGRAAAAPKR